MSTGLLTRKLCPALQENPVNDIIKSPVHVRVK